MPDNESREQLLSEISNLQKQVEALRELESQHSEAEAALRESEGKCRQLFEKMSIGLGFAELDGTLIEFNDAMLESRGYVQDDGMLFGESPARQIFAFTGRCHRGDVVTSRV